MGKKIKPLMHYVELTTRIFFETPEDREAFVKNEMVNSFDEKVQILAGDRVEHDAIKDREGRVRAYKVAQMKEVRE